MDTKPFYICACGKPLWGGTELLDSFGRSFRWIARHTDDTDLAEERCIKYVESLTDEEQLALLAKPGLPQEEAARSLRTQDATPTKHESPTAT
jgi:hypothetical protein